MEHNKEKSHPVQQYFSFSTENNASQCTLCKTQLKGRHSSNLLRHLKSHHARTYEMIVPLIKQYHQSRSEKEKNITATFNLAKVTKALVCLVAVDGRPFSLMDDVGLKSLLDPIFNACDKNGVPYRINRRNIADHVTEYEKKKLKSKSSKRFKANLSLLKGMLPQFMKGTAYIHCVFKRITFRNY